MKFTIVGKFFKENCLPDLNDLLNKHPMVYNKLKKDMERVVIAFIRKDLRVWKPQGRVHLDIIWGEKNKGRKRDLDNLVGGGRKIINDSLTKAGIIEDDDPSHMGYGNNEFVYTDKPFVQVEIVEERTEL